MRAFLAFPVDGAAVTELAALRERLGRELAGVRWASAGAPHLTVRFLGEVGEADADEAVARLRPLVAQARPQRLHLCRLGWFGGLRRPRALWLGPDRVPEELSQLIAEVRRELRALGDEVDEPEVRLHCTLGRPGSGWSAAAAQDLSRLAAVGAVDVAVRVDRLVLYESIGAPLRHLPRADLPLGDGSGTVRRAGAPPPRLAARTVPEPR